MRRFVSFLLLFCFICLFVSSCGKQNISETTEATTIPTDQNGRVFPENAIPVVWKPGKILSSDSEDNKFHPFDFSRNYHSYTNVIKISKAGTTVSFFDDNSNENDDKFAGIDTFVVSHWKFEGGKLVLDKEATNQVGRFKSEYDKDNFTLSYDGEKVTYTYTTSEDDEMISLCFLSGQTTDFTPLLSFVTYSYDGAEKPEFTVYNTPSDDIYPEPLSKTELEVKWNEGYIASATSISNKNSIHKDKNCLYSDVITIPEAGTTIFFTDIDPASRISTNAYVFSSWKKDDNGEWIFDASLPAFSGYDADTENDTGRYVIYSYTTSYDNENIRISICTGEDKIPPKIYLEKSGKEGTITKYFASLGEKKYASLEGLTINFIGDSYLAGPGVASSRVWPVMLGLKYGMDYASYGIIGSTVSNYSAERHPMVNRISSMPNNDADIVIFQGGTNDAIFKVTVGNTDSKLATTFCGAVNSIISQLQKRYPNAVIIGITSWEINENNAEYGKANADAMREICEKRGVYCFYAYDPEISGINVLDASFREKYCLSADDESHLNADGMALFLPKIEQFIAECYMDAQSKK
ncbi:MAG: SGNH/GDSL hydrolase family protein [Eubacteriales bacterium]